jgi:integrase
VDPNRFRFGFTRLCTTGIPPCLSTVGHSRRFFDNYPESYADPLAKFATRCDGIRQRAVYSLAMQSVADWKGYRAMTVQRDRGRWRYRTTAYYANGRSVRITGSAPPYEDTREKAVAMEAEHVARVRALLPGQEDITEPTPIAAPTEPTKPLVPTVQEFHVVYLDSKRLDAKPSTMITTECDFRTHIVPRLGHLRLDEVTYAAIEDFKLALTKTQSANTTHKPRLLRPKSVHNLLVHVSDMLGVARKRGLIAAMPEIDWIKIPPSEFDFLDFDDADRLVAAAEGEWRTMILVAMRTGMRMGELLGLRWVDVDLSAGRINVRQAYVKGHFGLPKSGKPREIPLGDEVIEVLAAHRHERGPLVFCDAAGKPFTAGLLAWPLKRALKRAGLREIGWHTCRHSFASHLAMRGVPLKVIQELLGHASIATTMIYAHLAPHVARDAVRVLDRARSPVAPQNPATGSVAASPATSAVEGPASGAPTPARKSRRNSRKPSSGSAIPVEVAKDRRNPPEAPLSN